MLRTLLFTPQHIVGIRTLNGAESRNLAPLLCTGLNNRKPPCNEQIEHSHCFLISQIVRLRSAQQFTFVLAHNECVLCKDVFKKKKEIKKCLRAASFFFALFFGLYVLLLLDDANVDPIDATLARSTNDIKLFFQTPEAGERMMSAGHDNIF